jgi:methyltransferase
VVEGVWLIAFIAAERTWELAFARHNTRRLIRRGGVEFGAAHYPFIVGLHVAWLIGLFAFGRHQPVDLWGLAAYALLLAGRAWVFWSLGPRWTTRIVVVPGESLVAGGPYRFMHHPNYLIVVLELAVVPLALGLPVLAAVFTVLNAAMLVLRIKEENRALAWAAGAAPGG